MAFSKVAARVSEFCLGALCAIALASCSAGQRSNAAGSSVSNSAGGASGVNNGASGNAPILIVGGSSPDLNTDSGVNTDGGGVPMVPPWQPPASQDNCGTHCYFAPELPQAGSSNPGSLFGATPSAAAPTLIYPFSGSVHPLNMLSITFQWHRSARAHSFAQLHVAGATAWDFYLACDHVRHFVLDANLDDCVYELPQGSWGALAYENRGKTVQATLSTSDGASSVSAPSAELALTFSEDAVQGALYFWSIGNDASGQYSSGILRAPFGAAKAQPYILPGSAENPETCGGCHALSRNGEVIAFAAGADSNTGHLLAAQTETPAQHSISASAGQIAVLMTLNPDGSRLLAARGDGVLDLWDVKGGAKISTVSPQFLAGNGATHPEWSPDGTAIAVTLAPPDAFNAEMDGTWDTWSVRAGGIGLLPYNNGAFGQVTTVVPVSSTEINCFPTFSPDGKWLAFVTGAPGGPYMDNTQNPNTRLRLLSLDSGKIYELANASQSMAPHAVPGGGATWPKFAPFTQENGNLMFLTFHSHLDYGFFTATGAFGTQDQTPFQSVQLWFAAIDLSNVGSGDPSAAPIYLTLQDPTRANHLGFWSEKIGCTDSATDLCGSYATCQGNVCVPTTDVPK